MKKSLASILSGKKRNLNHIFINKKLLSFIPCILLIVSSCRTVDSSISDLKYGDSDQRKAAIEFLDNSTDPRVVELLIEEMTNSKNVYIRENLVYALGEIGDSCAIEPLVFALDDKSSDVQEAASIALEKIGIDSASK